AGSDTERELISIARSMKGKAPSAHACEQACARHGARSTTRQSRRTTAPHRDHTHGRNDGAEPALSGTLTPKRETRDGLEQGRRQLEAVQGPDQAAVGQAH